MNELEISRGLASVDNQTIIPRGPKGNFNWYTLKDNPSLIKAVIEAQAQDVYLMGGDLSSNVFASTKTTSLQRAISTYYPGGLLALRENLGLTPSRKPRGYWTEANIRQEALAIVSQKGDISRSILLQAEMTHFSEAITRNYPGGMNALRRELGLTSIPTSSAGRVMWSSLAEDNATLLATIESEVKTFIAEGNKLNFNSFIQKGRGELVHAIQRYYPDGMPGIQIRFGVKPREKRQTSSDQITKQSQLLEEAKGLFTKYGSLNYAIVEQENLHAFYKDVGKSYPGGWRQLMIELGNKVTKAPVARNIDQILEEAKDIVKSGGELTTTWLTNSGRKSLLTAINRKYPGKIMQLRLDLGLPAGQRANDYWRNPTNVEKEAEEFYKQHGKLDQRALIDYGRKDLWAGIYRHYPGRWTALRQQLGIPEPGTKTEVIPTTNDANKQLQSLLGGKNE